MSRRWVVEVAGGLVEHLPARATIFCRDDRASLGGHRRLTGDIDE
jgi:hypothetical protein